VSPDAARYPIKVLGKHIIEYVDYPRQKLALSKIFNFQKIEAASFCANAPATRRR
jgi:hypothetical protein